MKRALPFIIGVIAGAVVFGACGVFVGYMLAHSDEPAVIVRNVSDAPVHSISITTDVGETYSVPDLPPQKSQRVHVSGRPKALRIIATAGDKQLSSEEIYVSSEGFVFALVYQDRITVDYGL